MSYFVKHIEDKLIPLWLKTALRSDCELCGAPMLNYYNNDERCTNRRCSNKECPGMLAARFVSMCKVLDIKGVGYQTGLKLINQYGLKSHVDCIGYVLDRVLTIPLGKFLRVMQFEGVDGEWEALCERGEFYDLDTLYANYTGDLRYVLDNNKDEIYRCSKFFNFKQPTVKRAVARSIKEFNIMITGTPKNFPDKDSFVATLNHLLQGIIKIYHIPHKRKTNVDYLIREPGSTTKGKYETALEAGIPIVTSEEFISILTDIIEKEKEKEQKG